MLKEILREETRERKDLQKQTQKNTVNGNQIIHINNYLKYKWKKFTNTKA